MVRVLMRKGMTEEEAREYISFNVEGAYLGPETPIIYWTYVPEH
jgi:type II secretory pathway predicted ATPase ExeA